MRKKASLLLIIALISTGLFAQEKCNCEATFNWAKETFEKNDAGFAYAVQQKGEEAYEKHNTAILAKIKKATTKEECAGIIREWLSFFRKAHYAFFAIPDTTKNNADNNISAPANWPSISVSEEKIKQQSANEAPNSYEGLWHTGAYTIGVVKDNDTFKGVILSSANKAWKPDLVKFKINKDSSGVFYMSDYSEQKFDKAIFIGKNTLQLGYIYLDRVYPKFRESDDAALYVKEMSTQEPFIQKLSDKTILFRIPSFDDSQKGIIDSLLAANDKLLKNTENLIIDVRDNGGGSDDSYDNIIPLLYTNPIRIINTEFLSTPLNNKRMEGFLSLPNLSEKNKKSINDMLRKLNDNLGKFVNLDSGRIVDIQKLDTVYPYPKNVAVIVNQNNGSTTEQFLLAARQSRKVKLFGVTTDGVLDISNMYFVNSPDNKFSLHYCLSKSLRIPDMAIDGKGILPDYYLDKSIPDYEWLSYVQNILEQ